MTTDDSVRILREALGQNEHYAALCEAIQAERDQLVARILGGRLSADEYASLTGEVRGLDRWLAKPRQPEPYRR